MGLSLDIFVILANKFTACRIKRDLTRGINKLTAAYGLAIRANSPRSVRGADLYAMCLLHKQVFPLQKKCSGASADPGGRQVPNGRPGTNTGSVLTKSHQHPQNQVDRCLVAMLWQGTRHLLLRLCF